jgi:cytochrome oxidase Cu insertion factor (SCO1/SenC/PrrC family)
MSSSTPGDAQAAAPDAARRRRGRLIAAGILVVCALPLLAALAAYFLFPPAGRVNYGELVEPRPLPVVRLERLDGRAFSLGELRGKWVMLHVDAPECGAPCQAKLFNMRQSRLAQGNNAERIERVWLVAGGGVLPPELARLYEGMVLARAAPELVAALPGTDARGQVYLIDPRGNLMLRFPADADPKRMIKDLQRLLKYSGIG